MYAELLREMEEAGTIVENAAADLAKETLDIETLELAHKRVVSLFATIRVMGVCRDDIETLNNMGITDIESKYYSDMRGLTGLEPALEAEDNSSWLSLVMGGIITALSMVLAYFAGKLVGWILGSAGTLDKASMGASKGSVVNVAKSREVFEIPRTATELYGSGGGYANLLAITKLGDTYLDGTVVNILLTAAEEGISGINESIGAIIKARHDNSGILKLLGSKELAEFKADASKANGDALINSVQPSLVTKALVESTYPYIKAMCGDRLDQVVGVDATKRKLESQQSISAKSQKVASLRSGGDFYDSKLTVGDVVSIETNIITVDFASLEGRQKSVKAASDKLSASGRDIIKSGNDTDANKYITASRTESHFGLTVGDVKSSRAKLANAAVRRVINIEIAYPAQYVVSLVNVVTARLLKTMLSYKYTQTKIHIKLGKLFHQSHIDKLINLINKSPILDDAEKKKLLDKLDTLINSEVQPALKACQEVFEELSKKDAATMTAISKVTTLGDIYAPGGVYTKFNGDLVTLALTSK